MSRPTDFSGDQTAESGGLFDAVLSRRERIRRRCATSVVRPPCTECELSSRHREVGRVVCGSLAAANGEPELLTVATDPMVHRVIQMHRNVKRAAHKMKAFVRFRRVGTSDVEGDAAYVAWFEPAHYVVERVAPFFARRFPSMRWSILTPDRCAHWDLQSLSFTDGVDRSCRAER